MTYKEILTLVSKEEPLPLFQALADRLCYESLAKLKAEYELAGVGEKQVKIRKQEIRRAHEEYTEAHRQYLAVYRGIQRKLPACRRRNTRNLGRVETAVSELPAAFQKAMNCLGTLCNDSATAQIIQKIMNQKTPYENY